MRRIWLGAVLACVGAVIVPVASAQAEEMCGGRPVTIAGTAGDDEIDGTAGNDVIAAEAGNDHVRGLGGHDIVCLGAGHDIFLGDAGNDRLVADAGEDGSDAFLGGAGEDVMDYGARTASLRVSLNDVRDDGATNEQDLIRADVESVVGGAGDDELSGSGDLARNVLVGGDGRDRLAGFAGDDRLLGGSGDDILFGDSGSDELMGQDGVDFLLGGQGDDRISGGAGNDVMRAESVADGSDTFSGGIGLDTVAYDRRTAGIRVSLNGVPDDGEGTRAERDNVGFDMENVDGGQAADIIHLDSTAPNTVRAGAGDDDINTIDGIIGNDKIDGGQGIDRCTGDPDAVSACP